MFWYKHRNTVLKSPFKLQEASEPPKLTPLEVKEQLFQVTSPSWMTEHLTLSQAFFILIQLPSPQQNGTDGTIPADATPVCQEPVLSTRCQEA